MPCGQPPACRPGTCRQIERAKGQGFTVQHGDNLAGLPLHTQIHVMTSEHDDQARRKRLWASSDSVQARLT